MLKLEIVTPEKRVLEAEVDSVTIPTASGEVGILPNHAPLISALKPGVLSGGFVEVNSNKVSVLADTAETADEIDLELAKADREIAEKAFAAVASGSVEETEDSRDQIEAANVRIQLAGGK